MHMHNVGRQRYPEYEFALLLSGSRNLSLQLPATPSAPKEATQYMQTSPELGSFTCRVSSLVCPEWRGCCNSPPGWSVGPALADPSDNQTAFLKLFVEATYDF
jgi:hypothetical protein